MRYSALEHGSVLELSDWDERTVDKWKASNPRIAIPSDLPSNATVVDAIFQLPTSSSILTGNNREGAIVAAGFPLWELLNVDNPNSIDDDAMRLYYEKLSHDIFDPEQRKLQTKVSSFMREQFPERAISFSTTAIPTVAKLPIHPAIALPMLAGRTILSMRSLVHNFAIDKIDDTFKLDPEHFANIKWFTKPLTERARDNELRDAAMGLLLPETIGVLEKMGISGNAVPLVDESHTSARYSWNNPERQEHVVAYNAKKMAEFRRKLAGNKKMKDSDWDIFSQELTKLMGSVKIFGVAPISGSQTIGSVTNRHQPKELFISKRVNEVISSAVSDVAGTSEDQMLKQLIEIEEDLYPGSTLNDF